MESLLQRIEQRHRLVGAAVGSGMTAKAAEEGGADFQMVLTAGVYRMQGRTSMCALLPYANANQLAWKIATEQVMPCVQKTPLLLGVCAQDPNVDWPTHLTEVKARGFCGITNFPSVIFFDGDYRAALEAAGLGFDREVALLAQARAQGLLTIGFCLTEAEAIKLAQAQVDVICLDLGFAEWQKSDELQHQADLDQAILVINRVITSVKKINPKPYVVCFSGPVLFPQDTAIVYQRTGVLGYVGGSTIERFPAAPVITQTVREFRQMAQTEKQPDRLGSMIGRSPAMQKLFATIRQVAQSNAPVLIVAESGSGKELAAREIHRLSRRFTKPMVCWNCGAMTESLAMSELFGHEKGSFTGASRTHIGKFEAATGGTLFMDEVSDLPPSVQASLLRAIQEKEIIRVGGEKPIQIDARLIAASNRNFHEMIPAGKFRLDLYYRLSTIVLRIPPLRERREDIPLLVHELAQEFSQVYGCPVPRIPDAVMKVFVAHTWPGNIRELRNVIERGFILGGGKNFSPAWLEEMFTLDQIILPASAPTPITSLATLPIAQASKRERLTEVLAKNRGNKLAAARELGVTRKTIYNWLNS